MSAQQEDDNPAYYEDHQLHYGDVNDADHDDHHIVDYDEFVAGNVELPGPDDFQEQEGEGQDADEGAGGEGGEAEGQEEYIRVKIDHAKLFNNVKSYRT